MPTSKSSTWRRLLNGPRILLGLLVGALIGFVVPFYGPDLIDLVMPGRAVRHDASSDPLASESVEWAFEQSLSDIEPPPFDESMINWFLNRGGVQAGHSDVKVVVEGRRATKVTITGLRARVLQRRAALRGTLFYSPAQAAYDNSQVGLNLDQAVPVARRVKDSQLGEPFFADRSVELGRGEKHTFQIRAVTAKCFCTWEIELALLVNGRPQRAVLRDRQDQPFRTTAWASSYEAVFLWNALVNEDPESRWVPVEPSQALQLIGEVRAPTGSEDRRADP